MGKRRGPSNEQLRSYAATLRELARKIEPGGSLVTLLERDAALAVPDGFGPGTLGGGGAGKSDPTMGAALARAELAEKDPAIDYLHACATTALGQLDQAVRSAFEVGRQIEEGFKVEEMVVGRELDSEGKPKRPDCVEGFCEEPSDPGREGRCEPCYRWRKRWRDRNAGRRAARAGRGHRTAQAQQGASVVIVAFIDRRIHHHQRRAYRLSRWRRRLVGQAWP